MTKRVVVVGASIGGLTVAETLREEGFPGEIILIGDERHLPYTRPPLSKQILSGEWEGHEAVIRSQDQLAHLDVEVRTGCAATGLDVESRIVSTDLGEIPFDELVIATGTEARRHPALPAALALRTMDEAFHLRSRLETARRVAIIGSGILGSEVASAARKRGAETTLVGRSAALSFGGLGTLLSERLMQLHDHHGVEVALSCDIVSAIPPHGGNYHLRSADGRTFDADLVVAMIGGTPRTGWLRTSSLDVSDGVVCDRAGRAAPGVWAVGDVAAWADPFTGVHRRVEHQSYAIEQALSVAVRLARGSESAAPVPLFWSEIHGTRIHAYGWFDGGHLEPLRGDPSDDRQILGSYGPDGNLRGVVGWNASPRAMRMARALVVTGSPSPSLP